MDGPDRSVAPRLTISVKGNLLANLLGQGWVALIQIAFLPLYLHFLGIEAYGLVGFYVVVVNTAQALDLGLSATFMRELARRSHRAGAGKEIGDLARTVELAYWGFALVVAAIGSLMLPWIGSDVIKAVQLPAREIDKAIILMVLALPLQLVINIYLGGLMALEKQMLANTLRIVASTVGALGATVALWATSGSVVAFFSWQLTWVTIYLVSARLIFFRRLPRAEAKPDFRGDLLVGLWRFAAAMGGLSVGGLVLTQLDKWILINLLSLESFGYYTLAAIVANALYMFFIPVFSAFLPRLAKLANPGLEQEFQRLYRLGVQTICLLVVPIAAILSIFSSQILVLWTQQMPVGENSGPILSLLVIGTAISGLMHVPFAVQIAQGWTRLALGMLAVKLVIFIPLLFVLATSYGGRGAALAWITVNVIDLAVTAPLTERRLIGPGKALWLPRLLFTVSVSAAAWVPLAALGYPHQHNAFAQLVYLLLVAAVGLVITAAVLPDIRSVVLQFVRKLRRDGC